MAERFHHNPRLVEKFAYQDEKDFTLEVPTNIQSNRVYFKGKKGQAPDENLFHQKNKQSIKVMVSACLTWNGATKPFFVNGCGVKMNAKAYKQHLQKELVPAVQHLYKHKNWIFVQDNTPSHCSKIFYKKHSIYILSKHMNGPLSSPNCNSLDYYFWNKVKEKVYKNRLNKLFENNRELKKQIESLWKDIAFSLQEIQRAVKQFAGRLKVVNEREVQCIKMIYG